MRTLLETRGWWTARAAGSKGDADVIALKDGERPRMIEVKSTRAGPYADFGPKDREELLTAAEKAGADAWLIWWPADRQGPRHLPASAWPPPRAA